MLETRDLTGALVKIGQGVATMLSGGVRLARVPYAILWSGLLSGAAIGAALFGIFGLASLWLPSALAELFAIILGMSKLTTPV